tara:strand:+ start:1843 stop:2310 length:468 start_codon:yes stop_codon:yes gene_type:complete
MKDKDQQLIWESYDVMSGPWEATIDGKKYTGIVRDLINDTEHIDEVDYPVADLDKFGMYAFTKDGLVVPREPEEVATNMDGTWVKYTDLTPEQKLNHSNDETESMNKADLKYPIHVAVNDRNEPVAILDGNHRLAKALRDRHTTIKTKLVPKELL